MRNLALACAALAIVASIVSLNLWHDLRTERQTTAQLRAQLAQPGPSSAGPAAIPQQPPATAIAAAPAASTDATPVPPAAQPPAAQGATAVRDVIAQQRDLLKDPDYRRAALAQARLNLPQSYPGLSEELSLTPEQEGRLFDLLAELQIDQSSTFLFSSGQQPDAAEMQEMSRRATELQRRRDEQIAALLGAAGQQQFAAYEQTRGARLQAQNLQRMMETSGMPLTAAQMKPITDAYVADQQRQRDTVQAMARQLSEAGTAGASRLQEVMLEQQAERNRSLVEAARAHLTAPQLERLQATLEQQLVMNRASARLARERAEAQARAGEPVPNQVLQLALPAAP
jgi:hypothetical protein